MFPHGLTYETTHYHHGTQTDRWWLEGKIDRVEDYLKCMRDCGVQVGLATHIPEVIEHVEERGWDLDFYMACLYNINREARESALVTGAAGKRLSAEESEKVQVMTNDDDRFVWGPDSGEDFRDDDPAAMCKVIRATDKTCLAFKILGAGRCCQTQEDVRAAFKFAFDNIKPKDAVVVGMFPKYEDEPLLNAQHAVAAMGG